MLNFAVIEFTDGEQIITPFKNIEDLLNTYGVLLNEIKYIDIVSKDGTKRIYEQ